MADAAPIAPTAPIEEAAAPAAAAAPPAPTAAAEATAAADSAPAAAPAASATETASVDGGTGGAVGGGGGEAAPLIDPLFPQPSPQKVPAKKKKPPAPPKPKDPTQPPKPRQPNNQERERLSGAGSKRGRPRRVAAVVDPATGWLVVPKRDKGKKKHPQPNVTAPATIIATATANATKLAQPPKPKKRRRRASALAASSLEEEDEESESTEEEDEEEESDMEGESEGDDDAADSDDDEEEESEEEEEEESSGSDGSSKGRRKRVRRERAEVGQPFKYADTGEADTTLVLRQLARNKAGSMFRSLFLSLSYAPDCAPRVAGAEALTPAYFEAHGLEQPLVVTDSTGLGPDALTPRLWPIPATALPAGLLPPETAEQPPKPAASKGKGKGKAAKGKGGKGKAKAVAVKQEEKGKEGEGAVGPVAASMRVVDGGNQEEVALPLAAWLEYWASPHARFHRKLQASFDLTATAPTDDDDDADATDPPPLTPPPLPSFLRSIDWGVKEQVEGEEDGEGVVQGRMGLSYSVEGFYHEFHVAPGGGSRWLYLAKGEMTLLLLPPTDRNVALLEAWHAAKDSPEHFLPLLAMDGSRPPSTPGGPVPPLKTGGARGAKGKQGAVASALSCCHQLVLKEGQTLLLPPCWALASLTTSPEGAAMLSGRFFHPYSGPLLGRAMELEGRLALPPSTTNPPNPLLLSPLKSPAPTTSGGSGSGSSDKGPPPLSAAEKRLCHRTLQRYLTRLVALEEGGDDYGTSTLIPQRECEGIRSLLELVRLGEKQRRRPLMWPRPKGVLVREGRGLDPLGRLCGLLNLTAAMATSAAADSGGAAEPCDWPAACGWCERARAAARRRRGREEEAEAAVVVAADAAADVAAEA